MKRKNVLMRAVLLICLVMAAYSAYRLYKIYRGYKAIDEAYEQVEADYTKPADPVPVVSDGGGEVANKEEEDPYFWILTPAGNYRYHIYSVLKVYPETEPFILWKKGGAGFLEWERKLQEQSLVENDVILRETDHTVILSCCEENHAERTLLVGRCCSQDQPPVCDEE